MDPDPDSAPILRAANIRAEANHSAVSHREVDRADDATHHPQGIKLDIGEPQTAHEAALRHGEVVADASGFTWRHLRQSPRVRCSGSVEFRTEGSDAHLWGTLTDISLHGCYVEMDNTFPIGTKVYLLLKSFGVRIQIRGTVRTSFHSLGMGIGFTEIEPGQRLQLQHLLDGLMSSNRSPKRRFAGDQEKITLREVDPVAFLDEITEFFRKKQLLSREEFHQIAERVRLP